MDSTPRAMSPYNDLYPNSGYDHHEFAKAMSRDIGVNMEEKEAWDDPDAAREAGHQHRSAVEEHASNEPFAYNNRETEMRPLSYNEYQRALATLLPNGFVPDEAKEIEELQCYAESSRRMRDGPWDSEMLVKDPIQVPGQSPETIVDEITAGGQQAYSLSSHERTRSTTTSSDTRSEAVFSNSSYTGTTTVVSSISYICSHGCGKQFERPADCRKHERYHLPEDERPYPCDEPRCGRRFVDSHKLGRHKKSHSEDRDFPCHLCNKRYKRADILQRHKKVTHMNSPAASAGAQPTGEATQGTAIAAAQQTSQAAHASEISITVPSLNYRRAGGTNVEPSFRGLQHGGAAASAHHGAENAHPTPGAVLIFTDGITGDLDIRFIPTHTSPDAASAAQRGAFGAGNGSDVPGIGPGVTSPSSNHINNGLAGNVFLAMSQPDGGPANEHRTQRAGIAAEISADTPRANSPSNGVQDDDLDPDFFPDFISRDHVRTWLGSGF